MSRVPATSPKGKEAKSSTKRGSDPINPSSNTATYAHDPRLRKIPPAPPAPRISESIADRIKFLHETCKRRASGTEIAKPSTIGLELQLRPVNSQVPRSPPTVSSSSGRTSREDFSPDFELGALSPYIPFEFEEEKKSICAKLSQKPLKPESSKEVIEKFSSFLKTREDSAEKYKRRFYELRKVYDNKKAELSVVQDHVKELRKKEEVLTKEKSVMKHTLAAMEKENQRLQEEMQALRMENARIRDEKEDSSVGTSDLSSKLNYTQVALDGQRLLSDIQKQKLAACEQENADLKQKMLAQQSIFATMTERICFLENAVRADIDDKNMVVAAFNLFMAKTQARVVQLFEERSETHVNAPPPMGPMMQPEYVAPPGEKCATVINAPVPISKPDDPLADADATALVVNIKKEKLSPEKAEQGHGSSGGQKRKEPVADDDDDAGSTDSVVFLSSSKPTEQPESEKLQKKQKCEQ